MPAAHYPLGTQRGLRGCLEASPQHGGCVPDVSISREPGGRHATFVTCYRKLLPLYPLVAVVTKASPGSREDGDTNSASGWWWRCGQVQGWHRGWRPEPLLCLEV